MKGTTKKPRRKTRKPLRDKDSKTQGERDIVDPYEVVPLPLDPHRVLKE